MSKLRQVFSIEAQDKTGNVLKGVEQRFNRMSKSIQNVGSTLTKRVTAPIAAVAGGLALLGKQGLDSADKIGKLNKRLGASTEFLSEMRFVASQSGIAYESLTKSLEKMSKGIGEAGLGIGQARIAFDELGISVDSLKELSPEKQFETLLKSLNDVEDLTQRTALATQIFGRSGTELLQIGDSYDSLRDKARELGYSLSNEQTANAEKFNDAMDVLRGTLSNFATQLATDLAPALTNVVEKVKDGIKWFTDLDKNTQKIIGVVAGVAAAIGPLVYGFGSLVGLIPKVIAGIKAIRVAFAASNPLLLAATAIVAGLVLVWKKWGDDILKIVEPVLDWLEAAFLVSWDYIKVGFKNTVDFINSLWGAITEALEPVINWLGNAWQDTISFIVEKFGVFLNAWNTTVNKLVDFFAPVIETILNMYSAMISFVLGGLSNVIGGIADVLDRLPDSIVPDGWVEGLRNAETAVSDFGSDFDLAKYIKAGMSEADAILQEYLERINQKKEQISQSTSNATGTSDPTDPTKGDRPDTTGVREAVGDVNAVVKTGTETIETFSGSVNKIFENMNDGLADSFTNAIVNAESFSETMKDIFRSLASQLIKLGFSYLLGSFFGGAVKEVISPGMTAPTGVMLDPGPPGAPSFRAIGGPVKAGRPYMVGESGRELFVPNTDGNILNQRQMGGNNTYNHSVNIQVDGLTLDDPRILRKVSEKINSEIEKNIKSTYRLSHGKA